MTTDEALGRILRELGELRGVADRIADQQLEDHEGLRRHGRRLRKLELEAERRSVSEPGPDWKADPAEITGTYELRTLIAERAERNSDAKHLRRKKTEWLVAGLGAIALLIITTTVSVVTAHLVAAPVPVITHK